MRSERAIADPSHSSSFARSPAFSLLTSDLSPNSLHASDLIVVVLYFVFTLGVGLWVARQQRSAADYFLGARNLPAWAILLSIVATETSALTVISVPGIGARGDLTFLQLTFGFLVGRIGVARLAPSRVLPGRSGDRLRPAGVPLRRRHPAADLDRLPGHPVPGRCASGSSRARFPLALVAGWSIPTSIVVMGGVTMIYTWFGGFKAVVWTDVLQLSVYLAGGSARLLVAWDTRRRCAGRALGSRGQPGKLKVIEPRIDFTGPTPCSAALSAARCSPRPRTGPTT